jgi:hypothetical protein
MLIHNMGIRIYIYSVREQVAIVKIPVNVITKQNQSPAHS